MPPADAPQHGFRSRWLTVWALFGTKPSLDRLASYLLGTPAYDDIRLGKEPRGCALIGLVVG